MSGSCRCIACFNSPEEKSQPFPGKKKAQMLRAYKIIQIYIYIILYIYITICIQHGLLIRPKVLKNFLETFLAADFPTNSAAFSPTCCRRSVHDFVPMVSPSLSMTSYSASNSPAAPRWRVHLGHGWAPYNVGALKETTGLRLIQPIENVHVYLGLC